MWRDFWLALSFANLVYLRAWADLLPLSADHAYYRKTLPGINLYFAVAGDVLALSLLTWLAIHFAPKCRYGCNARCSRGRRDGGARIPFARAQRNWKPRLFLVLLAAFCCWWLLVCVSGFFRGDHACWCRDGRHSMPRRDLLGVPGLPANTIASAARPSLARRLAGSPAARVIWLVFDEWDQRLTFNERAAETRLPVLDSLAAAPSPQPTRCRPGGHPGAEMATMDAIPSLLYGVRLARRALRTPALAYFSAAANPLCLAMAKAYSPV